MRLIGYCIKCRRVRTVLVQGWHGQHAVGICRDCEDGK